MLDRKALNSNFIFFCMARSEWAAHYVYINRGLARGHC